MATRGVRPGRRGTKIVENIDTADLRATRPPNQCAAMMPERAALRALTHAPTGTRSMWWATYLGLRALREQIMSDAIRGRP